MPWRAVSQTPADQGSGLSPTHLLFLDKDRNWGGVGGGRGKKGKGGGEEGREREESYLHHCFTTCEVFPWQMEGRSLEPESLSIAICALSYLHHHPVPHILISTALIHADFPGVAHTKSHVGSFLFPETSRG